MMCALSNVCQNTLTLSMSLLFLFPIMGTGCLTRTEDSTMELTGSVPASSCNNGGLFCNKGGLLKAGILGTSACKTKSAEHVFI